MNFWVNIVLGNDLFIFLRNTSIYLSVHPLTSLPSWEVQYCLMIGLDKGFKPRSFFRLLLFFLPVTHSTPQCPTGVDWAS